VGNIVGARGRLTALANVIITDRASKLATLASFPLQRRQSALTRVGTSEPVCFGTASLP